ncbi:hypothetical protein PIB30_001467 [Stylosanthes scabra]|uniref:Uncharacterized protein n=1 Tax=Stylosanthes scabra TaxID=79078 RepID=A0ABU6Q2G4_9FABA|nr:hypothetical protein [Stylosanthes scabra]
MLFLSPKQSIFLIPIFVIAIIQTVPILARNAHVINFRSPNLYPESLAWDPQAQHFLLGSLRQRLIASVSDAGVVETFISDTDLPDGASILGLAVDIYRYRILAVVHHHHNNNLPPFNALAAYDPRTRQRIFLSSLPSSSEDTSPAAANDVAVDYDGNAFVTNSAGNYIWKVTADGEASIFSRSRLFTANLPATENNNSHILGLNGIAYVSKGYLLVVQSCTGKLFKVDAFDGTARAVILSEDVVGADDIALRRDGQVASAVSPVNKMWFLKSEDSWAEGVVFDRLELDLWRFPTAVTVGEYGRVYVLYGHLDEGRAGDSVREGFGIAEMRSKREGQDDSTWLFVLVGMGFAYFLFWRFQMGLLVKTMDRKIK